MGGGVEGTVPPKAYGSVHLGGTHTVFARFARIPTSHENLAEQCVSVCVCVGRGGGGGTS